MGSAGGTFYVYPRILIQGSTSVVGFLFTRSFIRDTTIWGVVQNGRQSSHTADAFFSPVLEVSKLSMLLSMLPLLLLLPIAFPIKSNSSYNFYKLIDVDDLDISNHFP